MPLLEGFSAAHALASPLRIRLLLFVGEISGAGRVFVEESAKRLGRKKYLFEGRAAKFRCGLGTEGRSAVDAESGLVSCARGVGQRIASDLEVSTPKFANLLSAFFDFMPVPVPVRGNAYYAARLCKGSQQFPSLAGFAGSAVFKPQFGIVASFRLFPNFGSELAHRSETKSRSRPTLVSSASAVRGSSTSGSLPRLPSVALAP